MAEPRLAVEADEDLPRTLRRAKAAQEAAKRNEADERFTTISNFEASAQEYGPVEEPPFDETEVTVSRLDIPFLHLMLFFIKAVFAAIPALIILLAILWTIGEVLTVVFPDLIKMQILIRMPN